MNAQSEKVETTHLVDLERSQRSRAAKQPYQTASTASRNVIGGSEMATLSKRTHKVEKPLDHEASRSSWEAMKAIGSARAAATAMIQMGYEAGRTVHATTYSKSKRHR